MSPRIALATAARVLLQLRRDPRTIALLLAVPCLLEVLLRYVLDGQPGTFDRIGGPLLGIFPFISMFLVTAITMLRERTTGTLERLMTMPLAKIDLLLGYGIAFGLVAVVQAALTSAVAFGILDLHVAGTDVAVAGSGNRKRDPRHVARPVRERLRPDRVPGRAVPAGNRVPAAAAVRPAGAARRRWRPCSRTSPTCCRSPTPTTGSTG